MRSSRGTQRISSGLSMVEEIRLDSVWGGGRAELDRVERSLKGECAQLFEARRVKWLALIVLGKGEKCGEY